MEAPVSKIRRTTSVVVEQPGSDKILVDNVPDMSVNIEAVSQQRVLTVVVIPF